MNGNTLFIISFGEIMVQYWEKVSMEKTVLSFLPISCCNKTLAPKQVIPGRLSGDMRLLNLARVSSTFVYVWFYIMRVFLLVM